MRRFVFQLNVVLSSGLLVLLIAAGLVIALLTGDWLTVCIVLGVVLVAFIGWAGMAIRHVMNPLAETEMMIRQLRNGNFKMRTYVYGPQPVSHLNHLLNGLADHLEAMKRSYDMQENQLETLIENIGSSFMFIDTAGYIRLANHMFQDTFSVKKEEWPRKKYDSLLPYPQLIHLIQESIVMENAVRKTIVLPIGIERRYFDVYCAPLQHGFRRSEGMVVVFHDITDIKKLEQMRKDFVANVSHELKTPVTSLRGFSETLLEDEAAESEEVRRKFLTIIRKESERLEALIHDLLELSKIENETFRLDWQQVDLTEILQDTLFVLREKAAKKKIELQLTSNEKLMLEGDPNRLRQIFINLIDNAIAYSPENSEVRVSPKESGGSVVIEVADQGIGIAADEIPRIFERFYRVDKARSRGSGGTGLGLAIVKHLIAAHGGQIEVDSEAGEGTVFRIILDKHKQA
ncbi:MAG TPA: ATP-binding protein [Bacillales bacterium]|nr:ATP-binding protein [Bacillales bacterium]